VRLTSKQAWALREDVERKAPFAIVGITAGEVLAMLDEMDELRHAIEHALDCDQGTVLCKSCERLLRRSTRSAT
jgi:hypothetical protein